VRFGTPPLVGLLGDPVLAARLRGPTHPAVFLNEAVCAVDTGWDGLRVRAASRVYSARADGGCGLSCGFSGSTFVGYVA